MAVQDKDKLVSLEDLKTAYDDLDGDVGDLKNTLSHKADVIYDTASGDIASFPDGADGLPVKDLTVAIEPVQDLHGYSNPWPAGGGKNLLPMTVAIIKNVNTNGTWSGNTYTYSGVSYTINTDNNGNVISIFAYNDTKITTTSELKISIPTSYVYGNFQFNGGDSSNRNAYIWDKTNSARAKKWDGTTNSGTSTDSTLKEVQIVQNHNMEFRLRVTTDTPAGSGTFYPMLCLSGVGDATFAPYSNICPISGWTGANVTRTGKNLLSTTIYKDDYVLADNGAENPATGYFISDYIKVYGGESYYFSCGSTLSDPMRIGLYDENKNFIIRHARYDGTLFNFNSNVAYVRFSYDKGLIGTTDLQFELGSTASAYEAYQGTTIPISWQSEAGTVYGGTLDVTTGVLTVNRAAPTFTSIQEGVDGTSEWLNVRFITQETMLDGNVSGNHPVLIAKAKSNYSGKWQYANANGTVHFYNSTKNINAFYPKSAFPTFADFSAWSVNNPPTFCIPLAQTQTYQLDPVTVTTLLGQNNIWSDCGPSTVEYPANTKLYIDKKLAALVAALS